MRALLVAASIGAAAAAGVAPSTVFQCAVGLPGSGQTLSVYSDGSYDVINDHDGQVWLANGTVSAFIGQQWYGAGDGSLVFQGMTNTSGSDAALGAYTALSVGYLAAGATPLYTTFRCFASGLVHFEASFPLGAASVNRSSVDADNVTGTCTPSTHFPSFSANSPGVLAEELAWMQHAGPWTLYEFWGHGIANGFQSCMVGPLYLINPSFGPALAAAGRDELDDGIHGEASAQGAATVGASASASSGSGRMSVEARGGPSKPDTVILSASTHFHATTRAVEADPVVPSGGQRLVFGLISSVLDVPPGYSTTVGLFAGVGVHETTYAWGRQMRAAYNTTRIDNPERNALTTKLSYWTDNGAVYFQSWWDQHCPGRNCSSPGAMNAEDTLLALVAYHKQQNLPVAITQLDTWWFYQQADVNASGQGGSLDCAEWIPRADMFPKGLPWLTAQLPLLLYSWGFITPQDGNQMLNYTWERSLIFSPSQPEQREAQPALDEVYAFYSMIRDRFLAYGGVSFEEDNMGLHTLSYASHITAVDGVERWWSGFASPWCEANIPVQICEAGPADLLESLKYSCVDNSRDNIDNVPCAPGADCGELFAHRWHVGFDRMFMAALHIKPYQDNSWTMPVQPNSTWGTAQQAYIEMQWLSSILSAGPVGFSDIIGNSNASLVMTSCMADGTLLQASEPSTYVEAVYIPPSLSPFNVTASRLFQAPTYLPAAPLPPGTPRPGVDNPSAAPHFTLLAVDFAPAWSVLPSYLYPDASRNATTAHGADIVGYAALPWSYGFSGTAERCGDGAPAAGCLLPFDDATPLVLDTGAGADYFHHRFEQYSLSPITSCGWSLVGEPAKGVRVAAQRVTWASSTTAAAGQCTLSFGVAGAPGETVTLLVMAPVNGSAASPPSSAAAALSSGGIISLTLAFPASGGAERTVNCSGVGAAAACTLQ